MKLVKEEFVTYEKGVSHTSPVYVNPTKSELDDISKTVYNKVRDVEVRFIIDFKNKKLYVFTADLFHFKVAENLKLEYPAETGNMFYGYGTYSPNLKKIVDTDFSDFYKEGKELLVLREWQKKDWSFFEKYINKDNIDDSIKSELEYFERIEKKEKNMVNEEYDDDEYAEKIEKLINSIKNAERKAMIKRYYKDMVSKERPYDLIYSDLKVIAKEGMKGIKKLGERNEENREFDRVARTADDDYEGDEEEDYEEDPDEIIKSIQPKSLREFSKVVFANMKIRHVPKNYQIQELKNIKNGSAPYIPSGILNDFKRLVKEKKSTKSKSDNFKDDVTSILKNIKGQRKPIDKKKEDELYKGFDDIKEDLDF